MITRTITLQIYKPGRTKSGLLLLTMNRYAAALQYLLDRYRPEINALRGRDEIPAQYELRKLPAKDALDALNVYEIGPFKDALKLDFAMLAGSYLSLSRTRRTSYPLVRTAGEDLENLIKDPKASPARISAAFEKYNSPRSLLFGRYDTGRDFCLLKDELSGRYYAKLYLFPASSTLRKSYTESRKLALRYVAEKDTYLETRKQLERYLLFPLSYGRKEKAFLDEAGPGAFRMARLHYRGGKFYLAISIAAECEEPAPSKTYLGAARGLGCPIHITITGLEADVQKTLSLGEPPYPQTPSSRLHSLANRIIEAAQKNQSQILFEGPGYDAPLALRKSASFRADCETAPQDNKGEALTAADYRKLVSLLPYKAAVAGLPAPIPISPLRLYQTCPSCGHAGRANRLLPDILICTKCGFSIDTAAAGSLNLVRRFKKYKKQPVVFSYSYEPSGLRMYNEPLGAEFYLPSSGRMEHDFYDSLEKYLEETAPRDKPFPYNSGMTRQKYGLLRKLRAARTLSEAVSFSPCKEKRRMAK